jgi:hypothetical protein
MLDLGGTFNAVPEYAVVKSPTCRSSSHTAFTDNKVNTVRITPTSPELVFVTDVDLGINCGMVRFHSCVVTPLSCSKFFCCS